MKANEDILAIKLFTEEAQQANKNLEAVLHKYVDNNHTVESEQRKDSFVQVILSTVFPDKEASSAKELVAIKALENIPDKETCLEVASQICFGEPTMQEATVWKENFKDNYSEDDPDDEATYEILLKT